VATAYVLIPEGPFEYRCAGCGEVVEDGFDRCWRCHTPVPESLLERVEPPAPASAGATGVTPLRSARSARDAARDRTTGAKLHALVLALREALRRLRLAGPA
jgi:hypothetical protein